MSHSGLILRVSSCRDALCNPHALGVPCPNAASTVTVSFTPSPWNPPIGYNGYRPGSLSGAIKVSATGATNTPLTVPVGVIIRYY